MTGYCKNCKFCRIENGKLYMWKQKTSFGSFMQLDIDNKIKGKTESIKKLIKLATEILGNDDRIFLEQAEQQ